MILRINNWTKLVIVLSLMFSVFSISAAAQNKPLTKETLEELAEKLKGSLAEVIDDEAIQTSITEKWDARMEELVGKTRQEVVDSLLEDVKSVVKDEETVKKITESFKSAIDDSKSTDAPVESPKPTPKPNFWIKIVHDGWYLANFDLTWDEPGKPNQSWKENGKSKGWSETINISGDATNIRLRIVNETGLVWEPQRGILNKVLQPSDLNRCYRVTGTTLGSSYDNNCQ